MSAGALQVLTLCDRRSVAEVSALAKLPVGVVRVLLGDLIEHGMVQVQATLTERSSRDERIELMERTLRGLRTY
jgi:DNA-binding IclR family transcriptional regulator